MPDKKEVSITPALSKYVSFTDKVAVVDAALKGRTEAQRMIKATWNELIRVLAKYNRPIPAVRPNAVQALNLLNGVVVYRANDRKFTEDIVDIGNSDIAYNIATLRNQVQMLDMLETRFEGISEFVKQVNEYTLYKNRTKSIDQTATDKAKKDIGDEVNKLIRAIEAYDETVDQVANVREYISIVKDVADIAGIASGKK